MNLTGFATCSYCGSRTAGTATDTNVGSAAELQQECPDATGLHSQGTGDIAPRSIRLVAHAFDQTMHVVKLLDRRVSEHEWITIGHTQRAIEIVDHVGHRKPAGQQALEPHGPFADSCHWRKRGLVTASRRQ